MLASLVAASGCASILGIDEQSFDGGDAGDAEVAPRGDGGGQDDAHRGKDSTANDDGTTADAHGDNSSTPVHDGATADVRADKDSTVGGDGTTADAPGGVDSSIDVSSTTDAPADAFGRDSSTADASGATDASEAGATMPASCATGGAGMTNCGAGGSGNESCCASLEVTGGTYYRTYDPVATDGGVTLGAEGGPAGEADPATVSGFRLDKYLVTVGRFRQFVAAWNGGYYPSSGAGKHTHLNGGLGLENSGAPGTYETGWDAADWNNATDIDPTDANLACQSPSNTWTDIANGQENLPINCVNWYEAYAFCIWDGGFLPSEAEWEFAAADGSEQREYPWGSTDPGGNNEYAIYGYRYGANPTAIAPVGFASQGAGYWGQFDLAGEVYEWNIDWYATYAQCTDCADLAPASFRVVRGGYFAGTYASGLLASDRLYLTPSFRYPSFGFRCARTP